MPYLRSSFLFLGLILITTLAYSKEQLLPNLNVHRASKVMHEISSTNGFKLSIESAPLILTPNKKVIIRFQLLKDNRVITVNDLKDVHTQKIHLLIIDQSLTDYHHIHPLKDHKDQDFVFDFTPKKNGSYRMWVDITPLETNKQEFMMANLGVPSKENIFIKEEMKLNSGIKPYNFTLKLDSEPRAGQEIMATIVVTKNGKPFTQLEPIMGAFAHVVGFGADHFSVLHIHPMGVAPRKSSDRGGSELMFHIALKKTGFVRLFAQFLISGKNVYVPFGIIVK